MTGTKFITYFIHFYTVFPEFLELLIDYVETVSKKFSNSTDLCADK